MYQAFDAFEYVQYLRRRWPVLAVACLVAVLLKLPLSLLMAKRYTATASIIIEPPGSSDSRTAIVVSPMYLESLKTYERFAESDSLFERAVAKFHLQESGGSRPIESLKRSVLKVSKLRDTKILEISVTLKDPKLAQSLAEYLANQTVALSHGESLDADREFVVEAEKQATAAAALLKQAEEKWTNVSVQEPVESLQSELDGRVELQGKLGKELVDADASIAEYQEQQGRADAQFAREQLQAERARKGLLEKRLQELQKSIRELGAMMASRSAKRDAAQTELKAAQKASESAESHLRELRAAAGNRGERLRVMDPGIVPQRPSSPNVPLNVAAAMLLALAASILYLSFAFVLRQRVVGFEPEVTRGMRR
jgi:capsular polysaccharide biosynthesis protein